MKTYRYNGEGWYCDERSWLHRIFQWFIWVGGWETFGPIKKRPYAPKWWQGWYVRSVAPLSLFGHLFTYYGWGCQLKLKTGYLVWSWNRHEHGIYISRDGTPDDAHHWIAGTPHSVFKAVQERQEYHRKRDAEFEQMKADVLKSIG